MHVCITLRFAGTRYHGFQVQKMQLSVCEVLQNALESLVRRAAAGERVFAHGSGVHALGYCVSYTQPKPIPPRKLPLAVNRFLPDDVRVTEAHRVPEDFHARYSAKSKEYIYRIHNSAVADPFQNGLCWRFPGPLDAGRMERRGAVPCGKTRFCVVHVLRQRYRRYGCARCISPMCGVRGTISRSMCARTATCTIWCAFCGHAGGSGRGGACRRSACGIFWKKKNVRWRGYRSGAGAFSFTR